MSTLFIDVLSFLLISSVALTLLVFNGNLVWLVFGGGLIYGGITIAKSANASTNASKSAEKTVVSWEKGFSNWFIVAKSITSAFGVMLMNYFRVIGLYLFSTHFTVVAFLELNIFEAVVQDVHLGYFSNAITALGLMATVPFEVSYSNMSRLSMSTEQEHLFVFPLSIYWVLLYTSWNACFTYDDNLSLLTRLILIPPIIIAMYFNVELWLGARVLLLLLHLLLRGTQIFRIYQPGNSMLTPKAGSIQNSKTIACVWGRINAIAMIIYVVNKLIKLFYIISSNEEKNTSYESHHCRYVLDCLFAQLISLV